MINYYVTNVGITLRYMEQLPDKMVERLRLVIGRHTMGLSRRVLSKINSKTGGLAAAIMRGTYVVHDTARGRILGVVGVRGASKQVMITAGVQEYGASIPARIQDALGVGKMKFQINSTDFFARRVEIPAITLPAKSFLRSSLGELKGAIQADINDAVKIESAP